MNNRLALLVALLLASGCNTESERSIPSDDNRSYHIIEFNGHTYVEFYQLQGGGIVHDPDCEAKDALAKDKDAMASGRES